MMMMDLNGPRHNEKKERERETCGSLTKRPVGLNREKKKCVYRRPRMMDAASTRRKEKQMHGLSGRVPRSLYVYSKIIGKVVTR